MELHKGKRVVVEDEPFDVVVDGKIVGKIKAEADCIHKWHASIQLYGEGGPSDYTLIQGWGDEPDAAVADAIKVGKETVLKDAKRIAKFVGNVNPEQVDEDMAVAADLLEENGFVEAAKLLRAHAPEVAVA